MRPSIDHSILSPSGRMSQRARKAAMSAEAARLFPPGYFDKPEKTPEELLSEKRTRELRHATQLRALASRGMCTRKYTKEADAIEAHWAGERG